MKGRITVAQAAKRGKYRQEWICVLIRRGKIKAIKEGKYWYVSTSSFNTYLAKQAKHKRRGRPRRKG